MNDQPPRPIEPGPSGTFRASSASRSPAAPATVVPLPLRAVLLPFSPGLWRTAARSRAGWVIAPLVLLSTLAGLTLGVIRGVELRGWILQGAQKYDDRFDPVVVEDGRVRVEGERLPIFTEADSTFLVDPEGVFSLEDITTPEYVVVRREEIVHKRAFREQTFLVRDLMGILGLERLVVNGASIRRFGERWGAWLGLAVALFLTVFGVLGDAVVGPLYALAAAGLLVVLRRSLFAGAFGTAMRLALATYAIPIVGDLALSLLGASPPCCLTFLFWPVLMTVAGLLAVGNRARL